MCFSPNQFLVQMNYDKLIERLYLDIATEIKDDLESNNISKLVTVEESLQ